MKTIIYVVVTFLLTVVFTLHIAVPDTEPVSDRYYMEVIKACEGTLAAYENKYGPLTK